MGVMRFKLICFWIVVEKIVVTILYSYFLQLKHSLTCPLYSIYVIKVTKSPMEQGNIYDC